MSAREEIMAAVRANQPAGDFPLPETVVFPMDERGNRTEFFLHNLGVMGGSELYVVDGLATAVQSAFPDAAVIASAVPEMQGNRDLSAVAEQADLHDVDVAVVRAVLAVGETGSVLLADSDIVVNSLVYLAQHLVVLVDPDDIVPGLQDAYLSPEFQQHAYLAFHSGPSATADIEGVLIHGAQGVRTLQVALIPRS